MSPSLSQLVLYCRAGFEAECAQEIQQRANEAECFGFARTERGQGFVTFECYEPGAAQKLASAVDFHELIFARQWLVCTERFTDLPTDDRVTPLVEKAQALADALDLTNGFRYLEVEAPDTEESHSLLSFCRKFTAPLSNGLKKAELLKGDKKAPQLHVFLLNSSAGYIGYSPAGNSARDAMGIPRLKFPKQAPSRSTLKLEEAWRHFLSPAKRKAYLQPGMKAVDLGAAPGGWTWQLVNQDIRVAAIDNGPMDEALMDSGLVEHIQEDGFKYWPQKKVDWLVCDMVEKPIRVADLMAHWLLKRRCEFAIFNLKLPMKKRYEEVQRCFDRMREILDDAQEGDEAAQYQLRAKQLYHDREEITVFIHRPTPERLAQWRKGQSA
ncbi:RNA 2-O-ribose methyltransferase, SAM-dependent domain [gamma proteobacterium HTCC5015]|nr:RNA 2-O-ribose methyltransferase, SAM-dependent domain [gamma proteobacterium HTCC5015]